jgi:rubredoxin-NAD+ reductase
LSESIVIVGSGLAGYTLARELRKLDKTTPLVIVTRDDGAFYSKPMLSNALTGGKRPEQLAVFNAADMATQLDATIHANTVLTALDCRARTVDLLGGGSPRAQPYGRLVLAVGAEPVHLDILGDGIDHMYSVNDLTDYARFRAALEPARRIAVLGAGLVGCEFANDLCSAGKSVHVIEPAHGPLARFLPPAAQRALQHALEQVGVHWHFGSLLAELHRASAGVRAVLKRADESGEHVDLEVDLVLSAVGLRPRVHVAEAAGIRVNRGITVDRRLRSSDPHVFALGDCAEVEGHVLPFVQPLMCAARALAKTLAGAPTNVVYPAMPVVVKTPACPTVVLPPPDRHPGEWVVDTRADGVRAVFNDPDGAPRGFALTGAATADKSALAKLIPGLLE